MTPYKLYSFWDIMNYFNFSDFLDSITMMSMLAQNIQPVVEDKAGLSLSHKDYYMFFNSVNAVVKESKSLEFYLTEITAKKLQDVLKNEIDFRVMEEIVLFPPVTLSNVRGLCGELRGRAIDEAKIKSVLFLPSNKIHFFEANTPLFGENVNTKFPSILYDIEEAGKCFALDRATACVFHSIRSLEAGIRAISRCLQIPDPIKGSDRNWGNMLKKVKDAIDTKWPDAKSKMTEDAKSFEEIYAALNAIQNPWRNAVMHLDQKYTEEEAEHIFNSVKGLMKTIAKKMDEDGNPNV